MKSAASGGLPFILIGLAMLVGAGYLFLEQRYFLEASTRAEGIVVDLERRSSDDGSTYAPRVSFLTIGGIKHEFTSSTSSNPPVFSIGERVEVLYDPRDPTNATINSFGQLWMGPLILCVLGTVFFLVGGGIVLARIATRRKASYLKAHGRPLTAEYLCVEQNTSLSTNGRHPFRVLAQWQNPVTKQIHIFKSENIWFNPESHVDRKQLTVFVDHQNLKRYYVDVSFLPQLAD